MHCFVPGKPQLITKHNSKNLEKMRVSQRYTKGGVRVNDALDPVGERERGPGKRVKGPKRLSPCHSSKNATKEEMRERIYFSVAERAEGISRGDGKKMELNLAFVGRRSQAIFQRSKISLALRLSFHKDFQELESRGEEAEESLCLLRSL
jgi:hypothetical protein